MPHVRVLASEWVAGRIVRILRTAGYGGDLCVEDESLFTHPPTERVNVLRREVETLRAALAAA